MRVSLSERHNNLRIAILLITLLVAKAAFATAQIGDVLTLDGKQYSIQTNPLEPFLTANPDKLPKSNITSSGNWRGYIATWEIRDDRLLLKDIEILMEKKGTAHDTEYRSVLTTVFPEPSYIIADWFTGNIIIPIGKLSEYVHMGYASTFDKYIVLTIENGVATRRRQLDKSAFTKFRADQFAAFKKTAEYQSALLETMSGEDPMGPKRAEEFLREFYSGEYMSRIFAAPK
jgi:hypothetical protein